MLLPPALGFSPHLPVSVYGTGMYHTIAAFLDSRNHTLRYFCSLRVTYSDCTAVFPAVLLPCLPRSSHSRDVLSFCVPTVLMIRGTGISTCCPSATLFSLALGPDLPRADQLYSGNLGYSAWRIPTSISLLIPAFSFLSTPAPYRYRFSVLRMLLYQCLTTFLSFGVVFQPRTFSAQDLSTSELLRTL